jgi:hypothetical protein
MISRVPDGRYALIEGDNRGDNDSGTSILSDDDDVLESRYLNR